MLLTLDIGNTSTKYAIWNVNCECIEHGVLIEKKEIFLSVKQVFWISVTEKNIEFDFFFPHAVFIPFRMDMKAPLRNLYKTPETLGQDRWIGVCGLESLYPKQNCLLVDAGTCLKFDLKNRDQEYLGGKISMGLQMRYKALQKFTGKLPLVQHQPVVDVYGTDTTSSILTGVQKGYLAEVIHTTLEMRQIYPDLIVILTGGDMNFLANHINTPYFAEPLVIQIGLHAIFKQNFQNAI